jgi:hypothetical protein
MTGPADLELALAAPATRHSLRRRRAFVAALALGAVVLLALAAVVARRDASVVALQQDGVPADGVVVRVVSQPSGRGQVPFGSVVVRYDVAGADVESTVWVGSGVSSYRVGQAVPVRYDRTDPTQAALQDVVPPPPGLPVVPPLVLGVLLAAMSVVAGRHLRQIVAILRVEPWVTVPARVVQVPQSYGFRHGSHAMLVLVAPDGEIGIEPIGLNRIGPDLEPEVWVAGLGSPRLVVAVPGGGHVLAARPVRLPADR